MDLTQIMLLSSRHVIAGRIKTGGYRFLDVLNDHQTKYLTILDGKVFAVHDWTQPVGSFGEGTIKKKNVVLGTVAQEAHEAPQRRLSCFVKKRTVDVLVTVPGTQVTGKMHVVPSGDPVSVLEGKDRDGGLFFPLTEAKVTAMIGQISPRNLRLVLVNREAVVVMGRGAE